MLTTKIRSDKYSFTVIDAPGARLCQNMITGTAQSDAAVLVVASKDG